MILHPDEFAHSLKLLAFYFQISSTNFHLFDLWRANQKQQNIGLVFLVTSHTLAIIANIIPAFRPSIRSPYRFHLISIVTTFFTFLSTLICNSIATLYVYNCESCQIRVRGSEGYQFIVGWVSCCFYFVATVIFVVYREK